MKITKVIIIRLGGMGNLAGTDYTPHLNQIVEHGQYRRDTFDSVSLDHTNSANTYAEASPYFSIYHMIEESYPNAKMAAFGAWNKDNGGVLGIQELSASDENVVTSAIMCMQKHSDFRLLNIRLDLAEESGRHGYLTPEHIQAVRTVDRQVGSIYDAIRKAGLEEDSLIVLVSEPVGISCRTDDLETTTKHNLILWGGTGPGIEPGLIQGNFSIAAPQDAVIHALSLVEEEKWDVRLPDDLFSTFSKMNGFPNYVQTEIDRVTELARQHQHEDTLDFIFITDTHHSIGGNQLFAAHAVRSIAESLNLDFIMHGGDFASNGLKEEVEAAQREILHALHMDQCPLFAVKGNHDDNSVYDYHHHPESSDNVIYPEEMYEYLCNPLEERVKGDSQRSDALYYYADFPVKRVRIIMLDCIDIPYELKPDGGLKYPGQWQYAFSNRQLNWLAQEALDFKKYPDAEQWQVLVLSHVPILQEGVFGTDHKIANDEALWGIIQAYKQATVYCSSSDGEFAYDVTVDFTRQSPGIVAACLFGHVHFDQVVIKDGIPMISTLNAVSYSDFEEAPARKYYTESETAFDVFSWDLSRHVMNVTRFGAGSDRKIDTGGGEPECF